MTFKESRVTRLTLPPKVKINKMNFLKPSLFECVRTQYPCLEQQAPSKMEQRNVGGASGTAGASGATTSSNRAPPVSSAPSSKLIMPAPPAALNQISTSSMLSKWICVYRVYTIYKHVWVFPQDSPGRCAECGSRQKEKSVLAMELTYCVRAAEGKNEKGFRSDNSKEAKVRMNICSVCASCMEKGITSRHPDMGWYTALKQKKTFTPPRQGVTTKRQMQQEVVINLITACHGLLHNDEISFPSLHIGSRLPHCPTCIICFKKPSLLGADCCHACLPNMRTQVRLFCTPGNLYTNFVWKEQCLLALQTWFDMVAGDDCFCPNCLAIWSIQCMMPIEARIRGVAHDCWFTKRREAAREGTRGRNSKGKEKPNDDDHNFHKRSFTRLIYAYAGNVFSMVHDDGPSGKEHFDTPCLWATS